MFSKLSQGIIPDSMPDNLPYSNMQTCILPTQFKFIIQLVGGSKEIDTAPGSVKSGEIDEAHSELVTGLGFRSPVRERNQLKRGIVIKLSGYQSPE